MTIGESSAKTNWRTINALIAFLVWIMFFNSESCNAFILEVQAFWSPKTPSKMILFANNGSAITTSSVLQLPNEGPAHFKQLPVPNDNSAFNILQICIPTTTIYTRLQAYNDHHSSLNDVTAPQAFSAMAVTITHHNNSCNKKSDTSQAWCMLFASCQNKCQQCKNKKWKFFASCPIRLSNLDYKNSHAKSLAAFCPRQFSNYDGNTHQLLTSNDCWVIFQGSPTSCSSHHLQPLFQVDWCIGFWGSTFCSMCFWKHFHLCKLIESWGSMGSRNLFSSVQVDFELFQNIPSLPKRFRSILQGRMGGKGRWQHRCQAAICIYFQHWWKAFIKWRCYCWASAVNLK